MKLRTCVLSILLVATVMLPANERLQIAIDGNYTVEEGQALVNQWSKLEKTELERGIVLTTIIDPSTDIEEIEIAESLLLKDSKRESNPLSLAYYGVALALKSSYLIGQGDFMTSLANLELGLKSIDQAVELDKSDITIRFIRLASSIDITETSPIDLSKNILVDIKMLNRNIDRFNSIEKSSYYYFVGREHIRQKRIEKGVAALEMAIESYPNSIYAKLSDKLLLQWAE